MLFLCRLCSLSRIPLIPFGTGTGLEGGVGASEVLHHWFTLCVCYTVLLRGVYV